MVKFSRVWGMPSADTFDVQPIGDFVKRHLALSKVSVDPFARNKRWATHTNDLNPNTAAEHHMDAVDFLEMLVKQGVKADLVLIDPPYSPRQIKECYDEIGLKMQQDDALRAKFMKRMRRAVCELITDNGRVLTFGWNSTGMGKQMFTLEEVLLVCHGADHNDTICIAEQRNNVRTMF